MKGIATSLSCRQVLTAAAALAVPAIIIPCRARDAGRVVAVNFGGAIGEAKQRAVYAPFAKETGIEVTVVTGPDAAKLRAQFRSGDVEWDVMDLLDGWVPVASHLGLLERLDDSRFDALQQRFQTWMLS